MSRQQIAIPLLTYSVVTISILVFAIVIWGGRGVNVSVQNIGHRELKSVIVHVTGRSYDLGAIAPGQTQSTTVKPIGETHVELTIVDADSTRANVVIDCYFESRGYTGKIVLEVKDCDLINSNVAIESTLF